MLLGTNCHISDKFLQLLHHFINIHILLESDVLEHGFLLDLTVLLGYEKGTVLVQKVVDVSAELFFLVKNISYNLLDISTVVMEYSSESGREKAVLAVNQHESFLLAFIRTDQSLVLTVLLINKLQSDLILLKILVLLIIEEIFKIGIIDEGLSESMNTLG